MQLSASMIAGIQKPDGSRVVSPEANDIVERLRDHYRSQGKPSAAHNYARHLKSFFAWAEGAGYTVKNLPVDSVESFLASLSAAGQKETTVHVMRTQLKSALREAHNTLGVDFAHLEYQTGKPLSVYKHQKAKEKQKRHEAKAQQIVAQAAAIQAAQQMLGVGPGAAPAPQSVDTQLPPPEVPTEYPMSAASAPAPEGGTSAGAATTGQQPVVVVQMPQNTRPTATIGGAKATPAAPAAPRGVVINNHTFTGPYVRISRMADGTEPLIPPGTETYVQTLPASQLAPHGDIAGFLQTYIVPNLRLSPVVSQVHFIFHELNDRRQPTGRRDEMVVSVPMNGMAQAPGQMAPSPQIHTSLLTPGGSAFAGMPAQDSATTYLLKKLDDEAAEAKKRADEYQTQMREAKDAQTTFMLMQQFQKEQDLRRELEERRQRELDRINAPPPMPSMLPPMPFYTPPPPAPTVEVLPKEDSAASMVKALAEQQSKMMEILMSGMRQPPPPQQRDSMEIMLPFITAMNQQMMQQQQQNQQMMVQIQQSNQQFMQALLTRENPTEKILMAQIAEVKAAANAPKEDEMESFADKLQKMKMVSDMIGGGGGNPNGFLSELLANADTIGAGAARVIAAAKSSGSGGSAGAAQPTARVTVQPVQPQQLTGAPQTQALPGQAAPTSPPIPPTEAVAALAETLKAADAGDDQGVVNGVMTQIRAMLAAPEPFAPMGRRLLNAFREADDEGELYTFAKNLWASLGQQYDRPAAKAIARTLARWYSEIHLQVFGSNRDLPGAAEEGGVANAVNAALNGGTAGVGDDEDEDGEEDGQDDGDDEEADGEEASA